MKSFISLLVGAMLFVAPVLAEEFDTTTGMPVGPLLQSSFESDGPVFDRKVLWDTSHGVYLNYRPGGSHSYLADMLASELQMTVVESDKGVLTETLTDYEVLVVSVGSAWYSMYTNAEVNAIYDFVNQGGGLLILGDNCNCSNGNIEPVAQAFGSSLGVSWVNPSHVYVTNFTDHKMFAGVGQFHMVAAGSLASIFPMTDHAWYGGDPLVSAAQVGLGRVAVLGDINIFANQYINTVDNRFYAEMLFRWLRGPIAFKTFNVLYGQIIFNGPGEDRFAILAEFELGDDSDGVDFESDAVTVLTGTFGETLPPCSCVPVPGGRRYDGVGPGLKMLSVTGNLIYFEGELVDLGGSTNPAHIVVELGDDRGVADVRLDGRIVFNPQIMIPMLP